MLSVRPTAAGTNKTCTSKNTSNLGIKWSKISSSSCPSMLSRNNHPNIWTISSPKREPTFTKTFGTTNWCTFPEGTPSKCPWTASRSFPDCRQGSGLTPTLWRSGHWESLKRYYKYKLTLILHKKNCPMEVVITRSQKWVLAETLLFISRSKEIMKIWTQLWRRKKSYLLSANKSRISVPVCLVTIRHYLQNRKSVSCVTLIKQKWSYLRDWIVTISLIFRPPSILQTEEAGILAKSRGIRMS